MKKVTAGKDALGDFAPLFYAFRKQGHGCVSGKVAYRRARQGARGQMLELRKLRKGLSAAHRYTQRAEKGCQGPLLILSNKFVKTRKPQISGF